MKATSKVLTAPPICGVGGGAYSRSISTHEYAPQIHRKQKVKRDIGSQFLLASCCSDKIRSGDRQSSRTSGNVANAVGKAKDKCVLIQERRVSDASAGKRNVIVASGGGAKLCEGIARVALQRIAIAKIERKRNELANARTLASLRIKSMEKKQARRKAVPMGAFTMANAFAGL